MQEVFSDPQVGGSVCVCGMIFFYDSFAFSYCDWCSLIWSLSCSIFHWKLLKLG